MLLLVVSTPMLVGWLLLVMKSSILVCLVTLVSMVMVSGVGCVVMCFGSAISSPLRCCTFALQSMSLKFLGLR